MRRRWPVVAFILWTGYVWTTRILNAWTSSEETVTAKVISTVVATALLLGTVALAGILVRARHRALLGSEVRVARGMAVATVVVWAVRVPQILLDGDHGVPFKVVHVLLAGLSLVLAALTWRVANREAGLADDSGGAGIAPAAPPTERVSPGAAPHR